MLTAVRKEALWASAARDGCSREINLEQNRKRHSLADRVFTLPSHRKLDALALHRLQLEKTDGARTNAHSFKPGSYRTDSFCKFERPVDRALLSILMNEFSKPSASCDCQDKMVDL